MGHFLISYDLHNRRDYKPLWGTLSAWGAVRLLESVWVVSMNSGAGTIRTALQKVVDDDDSIVVIQQLPGAHWSAIRARKPGTDWLTRNIRAYP